MRQATVRGLEYRGEGDGGRKHARTVSHASDVTGQVNRIAPEMIHVSGVRRLVMSVTFVRRVAMTDMGMVMMVSVAGAVVMVGRRVDVGRASGGAERVERAAEDGDGRSHPDENRVPRREAQLE